MTRVTPWAFSLVANSVLVLYLRYSWSAHESWSLSQWLNTGSRLLAAAAVIQALCVLLSRTPRSLAIATALGLGVFHGLAFVVSFVYVYEFGHLPNASTLDFIARYPNYSLAMVSETIRPTDWIIVLLFLAGTSRVWYRAAARQAVGLQHLAYGLCVVAVAGGAALSWGPPPVSSAEGHYATMTVRAATAERLPERPPLERFEFQRLILRGSPVADATVAPSDVPNILIFRLEEISRDRFGLYPTAASNTPNLSAFRATRPDEFFVYSNHFSHSGATDTSVMTLYTGLHPTRSGPDFGHFPLLWDYAAFAGKSTFLVMPFAPRWGGLAKKYQKTPGHVGLDTFIHAWNAGAPMEYDRSIRDDRVVDAALAELASIRKKSVGSFLGIVSLKLAHATGRGVKTLGYETTACAGHEPRLQIYDCAIYDNDYQIGRVLDHLEEHGQLDDTVIFIVADHGADQRLRRNRLYNYYTEVLSIPLAIFVPRRHQAVLDARNPDRRSNVDLPTSNVDLVPSVVDVLGLTADPQVAFALQDLDGTSVFGKISPDRWIQAMNTNALRSWRPEGFALIWGGRHKYIFDDGAEFLFDLDRDPGETHNRLSGAGREARLLHLKFQQKIHEIPNMRRVLELEHVRAQKESPTWGSDHLQPQTRD